MTHDPTFSVIMPVFDAAHTLCAAVQSVVAQTLPDWELILIDDGSNDGSLQLGKLIARSDVRIRCTGYTNAGPSTARNRGLEQARGRFIAFLDADDLWHPDRLEGFAKLFEAEENVGLLFSRTQFIDADGGRMRTVTPHYPTLTLERLLSENPVCSTSNIACRRDVITQIGGFEDGLDYAEDQEWLVRFAATAAWHAKGVDKVWFYYRSTPDSQSADLDAMRSGWTQLANRAQDIAGVPIKEMRARAYAVFCRQLARRALRKPGAQMEAFAWLSEALQTDPHLVLREPRRTILTALGVLIAHLPFSRAKELVSQ
ncbi:MAG: glycosyltransferase [Pseudomonadota bacterium]